MVHPKAARAPPRRAAGRTMRLRTAVPLRRLLTRSRHVQRERLTAAQAKPRRGGDRSGALVARDAKGYVSSPSPSSERRDCGSPLLARQFRSPAFKETFCYSRGATTNRRTYPTAYWLPLLLSPTLPGGAFFFVVRAAPTRVPMCASRTPGTSRRRPSAHGAARAVDGRLMGKQSHALLPPGRHVILLGQILLGHRHMKTAEESLMADRTNREDFVH